MTDITPDTASKTTGAPNGGAQPKRAAAKPALKAAASSAQDTYGHLKEAATETVEQTKDKVKAVASQTADQLHQRYGDLEALVQLRPAQAIGIAAGVGLLVGLLLRGSSKTVYLREPR